jgi:aspartyl protease family protein
LRQRKAIVVTRPVGKWRPPRLLTILLLGLAGVVLILILRHDSGTVFGMRTEDFSRLALLIAVLVFVGAGLFTRLMRPGEVFQSIAFWFMAIVILVALHTFRDDLAVIGGRVLGALVPGTPIAGRLSGESDPNTVVVVRSGDGHFGVRANVNGEPMPLLVDTGASFVTLTPDDARDIGIDPSSLSFVVPIRTANGTIRTASIKLDEIAIGPIARRDIAALVAPEGALDQSLLGLSFLNTLDGYSIRGDRLVLNP